MSGVSPVAALVAAAAGVGWIAFVKLCPLRDRASMHCMLALCALGMLAGLAIDAQAGRVAGFAALCTGGDRDDLLRWAGLHWRQLPAMHAGMLAGGFAIVPFELGGGIPCCVARLARILACMGLMVVGMTAGAGLCRAWSAAAAPSLPTMLAAMSFGMVWVLVLAQAGRAALRFDPTRR